MDALFKSVMFKLLIAFLFVTTLAYCVYEDESRLSYVEERLGIGPTDWRK